MVDSPLCRLRCYAALGERFTFELKSHQGRKLPLVTSGPYGLVRHPGYLAGTLVFFGCVLSATLNTSNTTDVNENLLQVCSRVSRSTECHRCRSWSRMVRIGLIFDSDTELTLCAGSTSTSALCLFR